MPDATTEPGLLQPCSTCGGKLRRDTVKLAIWSEKGLVVVEGVAAVICADCQEQSYDDDTASALRQLTSDGFPPDLAVGEMTVPVYELKVPRRPQEASQPASGEQDGFGLGVVY